MWLEVVHEVGGEVRGGRISVGIMRKGGCSARRTGDTWGLGEKEMGMEEGVR